MLQTRLPTNNKSTQHPLADSWFSHAKAIMEACAIDSGGCDECELQAKCLRLFDGLAEKCSDKPLSAHHLVDFIVNYTELILGSKLIDRKKQYNLPDGYILTGKLLIRICLRCKHEWPSSMKIPRICPHCKSPYWNVPKENR